MKNMLKALAGIVLLAALGGVNRSQAATAYPNSVLNGCYGYLTNSVDVPSPKNRMVVGTLCFDGNGNIVPNVGSLNQSGSCVTTNGATVCTPHLSGSYIVTNSPGQGMGLFNINGACGTHAFSINSVDSTGLAHGFQFSLVKACAQPNVIGGTAYLQP